MHPLSSDFNQFMGNTTGAARGTGHAYPCGAPDVPVVFFMRVRIVRALVLNAVFLSVSFFVFVSSFYFAFGLAVLLT